MRFGIIIKVMESVTPFVEFADHVKWPIDLESEQKLSCNINACMRVPAV